MTVLSQAIIVATKRRGVSKLATVALSASLLASFGLATTAGATTHKPLKISNTVVKGSVGTAIKVTVAGGSGTGAVKFAVKGSHCTINATTGSLRASAPTTCAVEATKAASKGAKVAMSPVVHFTFVAGLKISNTNLKGEVGVPLTVKVAGAGGGTVSFNTDGAVCSINPATGVLSAGAVGKCPVTATRAASGKNPAVTSAPVTFVFGPGPQMHLVISNSTLTGSVGTPLSVFTSGGSGPGRVTFSVTGSGCTIVATTGALSDSGLGSCTVTATKAASTSYLAASSAPVTFTFAAAGGTGGNPTFANPNKATLTALSGTVNATPIDDTANGDKWFIIQYYSATDRWLENYVVAGGTIKMTWHVAGPTGQALANTAVTLTSNLQYSCSVGVTWTTASLNLNPGCGQGTQGTLTGTTDANGDVSFTLTNSNAKTGTAPTDTTTTAGAEANEAKTSPYSWTRMVLQIGSDVITANPNSTVNEASDIVDFIIIP